MTLPAPDDAFALFFERNPAPLWIYDLATLQFVAVNHAALAQYGYRREEFLQLTIRDIRPPEDVERAVTAIHALRDSPERRTSVWRHQRKDGTPLTAQVTSQPITWEGRACRLVTSVDITERQRVTQDLGRTNEMLQAIIRSAPLGIIALDPATRVTLWNPQAERMLGWLAGEVIGQDNPAWGVAPSPAAATLLEELASGQRVVEREVLWQRRDGARVDVSLSASALRDTIGRVRGFLILARDVTERRELEQQLLRSQRLEALGRLAGGVAHDFNNLLTAVLAIGESLGDALPAGSPLREEAAELVDVGNRASALTRQLLAFSRRSPTQPEELDLSQVVRDLDRMVRRLLGEDVTLVLDLAPACHPIRMDRSQLEQVIVNLAVNARDAMPGGGTLTLRTANVDLDLAGARGLVGLGPGAHVELVVRDTGTGMSPEVQQHIFEPFFTTKPRDRGTGLGLAMVYGSVHQAGGTIRVQSAEGEGSAFRLVFPRALAAPVAGPGDAPAAPPRGHETILVAEDDPQVRRVTVGILERFGYTVLQAADGVEALALAADPATTIALLVSDVVMPRMRGPELARKVRECRPGLRILFVSGYTDEAIVDLVGTPEGHPLLPKPFTPAELARTVREVLDQPAA